MIITIDIGNTHTTFGLFSKNTGELIKYGNIQTDKNLTTEELAIKFMNLKKLWEIEEKHLDYVIISSVVPQIDYEFSHMYEKYYNIKPYFIKYSDVPLKINYDFPYEIGADRIVNAYAGTILYPSKNLIIIDYGTATTFDIITQNNTYEGGLIIPGIITSLRAMEQKASKLPHINLSLTERIVEKNTINCIRSGLINGFGAMTDELIKRIVSEMKWKDYFVIATGGLSNLLKHSFTLVDTIDNHLTLKGLYFLWKNVILK